MKRRNIAVAMLINAGLFASSANASITYSVDRNIGAGSVKGTITTDGTIGRLTNGFCYDTPCVPGPSPGHNITNWELTLFDGVDEFVMTTTNSYIWSQGEEDSQIGTNLFATATQLTYDFDALGFFLFYAGELGKGGPAWSLGGHPGVNGESMFAGSPLDREVRDTPFADRSGPVVIGTAAEVPEPGSMALLALGLFGIGWSRKLKRA